MASAGWSVDRVVRGGGGVWFLRLGSYGAVVGVSAALYFKDGNVLAKARSGFGM